MLLPTVGRIVHYYNSDSSFWSNGSNEGPYAAIVTQVWPNANDATECNLTVFCWTGPVSIGSISWKEIAKEKNSHHWWEWPPMKAEGPPQVRNYLVGGSADNR
jgi:hypothetical protein